MPSGKQWYFWFGCVFVGVCEFILFWRSGNGYFFADSIYQVVSRPRTAAELIHAFSSVHIWYRPLSQNAINTILFPLFDTHFARYHALMMAGHMSATLLLAWILYRNFDNALAAWTGALFFGAHSVAFYATYDVAFAAEVLIALCLPAALCMFFQNHSLIAAGLLIVALLSKESAVVLPILALALIFINPAYRSEWRWWVWRLLPMFVILALYLAFYSTNFRLENGALISVQRSDYPHALSSTPRNLLTYAFWTVQLPRTWVTEQWIQGTVARSAAALAGLLLLAWSLVRGIRGDPKIRTALAFSVLCMVPTVAVSRCMPWHIYVPLMGVAAIIADFTIWIRRHMPGILALFIIFGAVAGFLFMAERNIAADSSRSWVAYSASEVRQGVEVIRQDRNRINNTTTIVVRNPSERPLGGYGDGHVFRFAVDIPELRVLYPQKEKPISIPTANVLVYVLDEQGLRRED